jgi:hypothetical protein
MAAKVQKTARSLKSKRKIRGFTVAAPPKNPELRRLLTEGDVTASGGSHTKHRRAERA